MISLSYTLVPPNSSGFIASTRLVASPQTTFPPPPIRTVQTTAAATMPATGGKPHRNHFHHQSLPLLSQSTTLLISNSKSALLPCFQSHVRRPALPRFLSNRHLRHGSLLRVFVREGHVPLEEPAHLDFQGGNGGDEGCAADHVLGGFEEEGDIEDDDPVA